MEIDTGAAVSVVSESSYKRLWPVGSRPVLQQAAVKLRTYTGVKD